MAKMLWDLECGECGYVEEDVLCTIFDIENKRLTCSNCSGRDLFRRIAIAHLTGAREDKPVTMGNVGKTFTSQKALAKYEKQTGTFAGTASETKEYVDRKRRNLDTLARSRGYRNVEHYQTLVRERKVDRESAGSKIISV